MLALERKNRILEKLQEDGRVVVSQLSRFTVFQRKPFAGIWKSWRQKGLP